MTIHEYGKENSRTVVLIHPSLVMWDYFEYVIPLLKNDYHLIIPALPGYDEEKDSDFTGVEDISGKLADWLEANGIDFVNCIYGCSMGGSVVIRFLADGRIRTGSAVIDGGITPYQLPWILTRLIAVRDFLMVYIGKLGGIKLLQKAFTSDEYSDEDLKYMEKVLERMSAKTIWRTFESCNNYAMPETISAHGARVAYWYAKTEEKERGWDIRYVKKNFPETEFRAFSETGHGGLAVLKPELFASELSAAAERGTEELRSIMDISLERR